MSASHSSFRCKDRHAACTRLQHSAPLSSPGSRWPISYCLHRDLHCVSDQCCTAPVLPRMHAVCGAACNG